MSVFYFVRIVQSFSRLVVWVAACALLAMMLLTCGDVVGRYIGYPIKGTFDVVGLLGAFVAALPLAYTQILRRHVAMEFMQTHGSKLVQTIASTIVCLLGIGVYALIAWRCYVLGTKFWTVGRVSDTIALAMYPFVYVVAFGCALNCLVLLTDLYNLFAEPKGSSG
jgi:TRAP-type C4-dicarboxylate transport system permease small subunit